MEANWIPHDGNKELVSCGADYWDEFVIPTAYCPTQQTRPLLRRRKRTPSITREHQLQTNAFQAFEIVFHGQQLSFTCSLPRTAYSRLRFHLLLRVCRPCSSSMPFPLRSVATPPLVRTSLLPSLRNRYTCITRCSNSSFVSMQTLNIIQHPCTGQDVSVCAVQRDRLWAEMNKRATDLSY